MRVAVRVTLTEQEAVALTTKPELAPVMEQIKIHTREHAERVYAADGCKKAVFAEIVKPDGTVIWEG